MREQAKAMLKIARVLDPLNPTDLLEVIRLINRNYGGPVSAGNSDWLRADLLRNLTLRESIKQRDGDRCRYCGKSVNWTDRRSPAGATYDHVDPDGGNSLNNVVVACHQCNITKNRRTPEQAGMDLIQIKSGVDSGVDPINSEIQSTVQKRTKVLSSSEYSPGFCSFWSLYPKRVGKDKAYATWTTGHCEEISEAILKAVREQNGYLIREGGKFIPLPATWLNQGRWKDEPPKPTPFSEKTAGNIDSIRRAAIRLQGGDPDAPA